jgi:hypothetical protein
MIISKCGLLQRAACPGMLRRCVWILTGVFIAMIETLSMAVEFPVLLVSRISFQFF